MFGMFSVCRVKGLPVYGLLYLGFVVSRVIYSTLDSEKNSKLQKEKCTGMKVYGIYG